MGFKRLTTRFLLTVLALFAVTTIISTLSLVIAVDGIVRKLGGSYAVERAEVERSRIGGLLELEAALAQKLADSPVVERWMLAEDDPALKAAAFAELESYRRAFRDGNYFVAVDSSKRYYNRTATERLATTILSENNVADRWYFSTVASGVPVSFNLDYDRTIRQTKVWINCLVSYEGKIIGIAGTGIDITDLITQLVTSEQRGVRTILIDAQGAITAYRDPRYLEENGLAGSAGVKKLSLLDLADSARDRSRLGSLLAEARAGRFAPTEVSLAGHPGITVIVPISHIGWMAVISVDASAAVAFRDFLPLFVLLIASLLVVLGAIALLMNRSILRPLAAMTASARQIAAGNYALLLPGERKDEIGTLASAFNEMAGRVKSYTEELETLVEARTAELTESNRKLEATNRQVMESIRYARLIQGEIIPSEELLARRFSGYSLFHRQRDVVGGDFLYLRGLGESFLVAVVDCAGHGVPGALMTMMVAASLDMIAERGSIENPAGLLEELEGVIHNTLHPDRSQPVLSGLDIGLCACLPLSGTLVFAGAAMPLYVVSSSGSLSTVAGRRSAVGFRAHRERAPFENHRLRTAGNTFFLVTDGYVDQAGGLEGRAYGTQRLSALFASCSGGALTASRPNWEAEFDGYRGAQVQRDDALAFGFRL